LVFVTTESPALVEGPAISVDKCVKSAEGLIVGGVEASLGEFPHMVSKRNECYFQPMPVTYLYVQPNIHIDVLERILKICFCVEFASVIQSREPHDRERGDNLFPRCSLIRGMHETSNADWWDSRVTRQLTPFSL